MQEKGALPFIALAQGGANLTGVMSLLKFYQQNRGTPQ